MNWEDIPEINFMPDEREIKEEKREMIFHCPEDFELFPPERIAEMDEALLWDF